MTTRLRKSFPLALAILVGSLMSSARAEDCPAGFSFEKLNDTYTCSKSISYRGQDHDKLEDIRKDALRQASRSYRQCSGPIKKPKFYGTVFSHSTDTEFEGALPASSGPRTHDMRGWVSFTCKLV